MIPLKVSGKTSNIVETLVGRVPRNIKDIDEHSILIYDREMPSNNFFKSLVAVISTKSDYNFPNNKPFIHSIPDLSHLFEGDIIKIDPKGNINSLFRINSRHNYILVTERCNCKCLMCSQLPKLKDDIKYLFNVNKKLIPLIPKDCKILGITGGEPTLLGDKFFELLNLITYELPQTEIHILSNGRNFSSLRFTKNLSEINTDKISFGIPLYADYYALHDYIVQAKSAFKETVLGIHNLARMNQKIEIRIVLHKLSISRLEKLAKYIYKNLPFVIHVAFMGLENTGFTPYNIDLLWVDPYSYMDKLKDSVIYLDSVGINVSIYNLQLCIMPKELWRFARQSISDWKNIFLNKCSSCYMISQCSGFFASSKDIHSQYINPIILEPELDA